MSVVEATAVSTETINGSLLDNIIAQTSITQEDDTYSVVKSGVGALIEELIRSNNPDEKVNKTIIDKMIAEIDTKISAQMDEILHHAKFQELESKWRGLYFLVERTDFRRY